MLFCHFDEKKLEKKLILRYSRRSFVFIVVLFFMLAERAQQ